MFSGRDSAAMAVKPLRRSSFVLWRDAVLMGFLMFGFAPATQAAETNDIASITKDYQAKAGFLFSFAKFVEWPTNAPGEPDKLCIGIMANAKVLGVITNELAGKRVGNKVIETLNCKTRDDMKRCGMIFITRTKADRLSDVQNTLGSAPVLTVGEFDLFTERGGCINFVRKGERIRLEVNVGAVERVGLKISSKISAMTVNVRGKEVEK